MAVQDNDVKSTNQGSTNTQLGDAFAQSNAHRKQGQQTNQQANQQQPSGYNSWRNDMGRVLGGGLSMSRNIASQTLTQLQKALADKYKAMETDYDVRCLPIDMNDVNTIGLSALVVTVLNRSKPELGVAFHTLILEGSAEPLSPLIDKAGPNNQTVEILRVAGDCATDKMHEAVLDVVRASYPTQLLIDADSCVVPRKVSATDENRVYQLAAHAFIANNTRLESSRQGFRDLRIPDVQPDPSLVARVTFGNPQTEDAAGNPIRGDIVIDFCAGGQTQNGQQLERPVQLSRVTGYMDLIYDPLDEPTPAAAWVNGAQVPQPKLRKLYMPHFIATTMETSKLQTLPAQLLALATIKSLQQNNAWTNAFKPAPFVGDVDMHDLGAIGIEANPEANPVGYGKRFDTKSDNFRPETMQLMLDSFFRPGLVISIDVPECGTATWHSNVLAAAGAGMRNANLEIIKAANILTGDHFSNFYKGNGIVCKDNANRIHRGTYTDKSGVAKDVRDIDYLAILNLMGPDKSPGTLEKWSNSYVGQGQDTLIKLDDRYRILTNVNPEITAMDRRITMEADFMQALVEGCAAAGLTLRTQLPYNDLNSSQRAYGNFMNSAVMAPGGSSMFNNQIRQTNDVGGLNSRAGFSRWG